MEEREVEKIEEIIACAWISDHLIPDEFFDDDPIMHELILQLENQINRKAIYVDKNIIIHGDGLYEGLFKKAHFESIKDKLEEIQKKEEENKTEES